MELEESVLVMQMSYWAVVKDEESVVNIEEAVAHSRTPMPRLAMMSWVGKEVDQGGDDVEGVVVGTRV